jgi:hypothetical protein
MRVNPLLRYPKATGTILAFTSLLAGATALVAADFGAPAWVFVLLLLWLATIGLPSTIAVLMLAALWGTTGPFYGLLFFCIVAAILAIATQVLAVKAVAHFTGGRYEN